MTTPANQPDALVAFVRARYDELERSVEDDCLPTPQADRVLADLDSKRRILDRHASYDFPYDPEDGPGAYSWTGRCDHCHEVRPCPDLRDLPAPFAGHPDYREEWRP